MTELLTDEEMQKAEASEKAKPSPDVQDWPGGKMQRVPGGMIPYHPGPQPEVMSDDDMKKAEVEDDSPLHSPAAGFVQGMKGFGDQFSVAAKGIQQGLGAVNNVVDRFQPFGAAYRSGLSQYQHSGNLSDAVHAYLHQWGSDPANAPHVSDILDQAGLGHDDIKTDINSPWGGKYSFNPTKLVGGVIEAGMDPTLDIGAGDVGSAVNKAANGVSDSLAKTAEMRAAKTVMGQNVAAMRKAGKIPAKGAPDLEQALSNIRNTGRIMLEPDAAGPAIIKQGNIPEKIGPAAKQKMEFFGNQIGSMGDNLGQTQMATEAGPAIGQVNGENIAQNMEAYADSISNKGKGEAVANRVREEAQKFRKDGAMSFAQAQTAKGAYEYKPTSSDALESSQDANNMMRNIIGREMDVASQALGSEENHQNYLDAKNRYGSYKDVAESATQRSMKNATNRTFSLSDYLTAGGIGAGVAAHGDLKKLIYVVPTLIAHKVAREQGSAMAARFANGLSKVIASRPYAFEKWGPALAQAANKGTEALRVTHYLLMNNDPAYRAQFMQQQEGEE